MGLLCTLQFTIRHLAACPAIPLFLYPYRCTIKFVSLPSILPCLQRLSHSVAHFIKDGLGERTVLDRGCQPTFPRTSSEALLHGRVSSDGPVPLSGVSTNLEDGHGVDTGKWLTDSRRNLIDLPGEDEDRAFSMRLLNRKNDGDVGKGEASARVRKVFSVSEERLELRSQVVRNLLLNILDLEDISLVGHVLNEWLRSFVSRGDMLFPLDNLSEHGDRNSHHLTGRFVPYGQVARIVHAVMRDLGQRGQLGAALEVLRWMEGQGWCQLDPHMYTTIIDTLGDAGSFELAEKIFESLYKTRVMKDPALYNAMLNARGKAGHIDSLEELFESMKQSSCKPDLVTYNTVMSCYVKAGMGLGTVVGIFRDMYARGIDPDLFSFDILLQACVCGRHVKEAEKIFENLKKRGLKPSVVTYTTMITLYARSGASGEALKLLSLMLAEDCNPNTLTFSSLITACGRDGNVEDAERLFQAMKELGVEPNVVTYNAMIDMYGKGGDCQTAKRTFKELEQAGLRPTAFTFASLMSSLKAAGAYDEVLAFYDQAKQESIYDEHVFIEAMDTYIKWGKFQGIKGVQSDMVAVDCNANVVTCSIILAALGSKCSSPEDAGLLVNFLQGFDSDLAVNSCNMLLEQMSTDEEVLHQIRRLFSSLDKEELKTWNVFSSALVDALWVLGWHRRAAYVVAWVMEKGLFDGICVVQAREWKLDLRRLSSGIALVALYQWLAHLLNLAHQIQDLTKRNLGSHVLTSDLEGNGGEMSGKFAVKSKTVVPIQVEVLLPLLPTPSQVLEPRDIQVTARSELGGEFPRLVTVVTGWGKLSKQDGSSIVKASVWNEILKLRAPFRPSADSGRWMSKREPLMLWLMSSETIARLVLSDLAAERESVQ